MLLLACLCVGLRCWGQSDEHSALSGFYYGVREYNLVTFGDFSAVGQDTHGGVAIGGNFTTTGPIALAQNFTPKDSARSKATDPAVIIAGAMNVSGMSTVHGRGAFNPTNNTRFTWNATDRKYLTTANNANGLFFADSGTPNPTTNWSTSLPAQWSFAGVQTTMNQSQDTLARYSTDRGVSVSSDGKIAAAANQFAFWNTTTADLARFSALEFTVPTTSVLVINLRVTGGDTFKSLNINNSTAAEPYILWNIILTPNAGNPSVVSTFTFDSGGGYIPGSVLAPDVNIVANRVIEGQVVANSYQLGNNELHAALFNPSMTLLVPEPATYAAILGVVSLGAVAWKRRRRTTTVRAD